MSQSLRKGERPKPAQRSVYAGIQRQPRSFTAEHSSVPETGLLRGMALIRRVFFGWPSNCL
jgi:hypothetical protein